MALGCVDKSIDDSKQLPSHLSSSFDSMQAECGAKHPVISFFAIVVEDPLKSIKIHQNPSESFQLRGLVSRLSRGMRNGNLRVVPQSSSKQKVSGSECSRSRLLHIIYR